MTRSSDMRGNTPQQAPPRQDCGSRSQGGPAHLSRKEREIQRHRLELLEAAEKLLARKRFHEITVQDIALESEFSVGYIYKLYPHKDDILAVLIRDKLSQLRSLIDRNLEAPGAWDERILNMLTAAFTWLDETPAYRSGVTPDLNLFARTHPGVAADLAGFLEFFRGRIQLLFSEGLRLGHLAEDEPGTIARTFRALMSGFSEDRLLEQSPEENLTKHAPLIVRVIKRAFAPEGSDR